METINKMNDGLKEIKSSFTVETVKSNLITALNEIKTICAKKEYVVEGSLDKIISDINLENSTLSSRKKLARKIYFFMNKKTKRTMSALTSFVVKRFLSEEYKVKIKPSLLEQEIISLREGYKRMRQETEEARLQLKEKKKLLNSKVV